MTLSVIAPTIQQRPRDFLCVRCLLREDLDRSLPTPRAVFQHLLWHRDVGHAVSKEMLDQYDSDFDPLRLPPHDPAKKGRTSSSSGPILSGSYGDSKSGPVMPETLGGPRGRLHQPTSTKKAPRA